MISSLYHAFHDKVSWNHGPGVVAPLFTTAKRRRPSFRTKMLGRETGSHQKRCVRDSALKAIKGSKIELHRKDCQGMAMFWSAYHVTWKVKVKLFRQKGIWLVVMMIYDVNRSHNPWRWEENKMYCTLYCSASSPVADWIKLCRECFSKLPPLFYSPSSLSNQLPNDQQETWKLTDKKNIVLFHRIGEWIWMAYHKHVWMYALVFFMNK